MYKICQTEKSLARQRELENGFLDYLDNVFFYDMDVTGLCRHLEIPRKTFYRYFGTKEDALYALIDHRLIDMDQYINCMRGPSPSVRQDAISFFSFWKKEKHFLDILKKNYLLAEIFARINSPEVAEVREYFYQKKYSAVFRPYIYNYHSSGILSIMMQWYTNDFSQTVTEMADLVDSLYATPFQSQFYSEN